MKAKRMRSMLLAVGLCLATQGCDKKDEEGGDADKAEKNADSKDTKDAEDSPKKDPRNTEGVKVGDSCEGISASEGLLACSENNVVFCSSVSKYKWQQTTECGDKKCVVEGKSASCK